jgi:hypothetical protein
MDAIMPPGLHHVIHGMCRKESMPTFEIRLLIYWSNRLLPHPRLLIPFHHLIASMEKGEDRSHPHTGRVLGLSTPNVHCQEGVSR